MTTHFYALFLLNRSEIKKIIRTSSCLHVVLTLGYPDIGQNTLDTFTQMLIGNHVTQIFLRPLSHNFHWSPGHMAIYRLLLAKYHFRKHVTSHMIVMPKSPLVEEIYKQFLCICNLQ